MDSHIDHLNTGLVNKGYTQVYGDTFSQVAKLLYARLVYIKDL